MLDRIRNFPLFIENVGKDKKKLKMLERIRKFSRLFATNYKTNPRATNYQTPPAVNKARQIGSQQICVLLAFDTSAQTFLCLQEGN